MKWVLDLEKELNIDMEFANSIDDVDTSASDEEHSFGLFVQKLDRKVKNGR